MAMTKQTILKMLEDSGGVTTEHPFVETGQLHTLNELVRDGYLKRFARAGDLDEIRITDKGRDFLSQVSESSAES